MQGKDLTGLKRPKTDSCRGRRLVGTEEMSMRLGEENFTKIKLLS